MATTSSKKPSLKQFAILAALSIVAILFHHVLYQALSVILHIHQTLILWLGKIFSNSATGNLIEETIALLLIPGLFALIATGIYWIFKRSASPYTMLVIWIMWLILLTLTTVRGML